MMFDLPKRLKRELRQLNDKLYERDLGRHLGELADSFALWKAGRIDVWELSDRIHRFHNGPSRDLYSQYVTSRMEHMNVAYALTHGLLDESEASSELREALANAIAFYQDTKGRLTE